MGHPADLPWTLESLDLGRIDHTRIRDDEDLFFLLCSASFVESGSDLYSQNLIAHFAGDAELQHIVVLKFSGHSNEQISKEIKRSIATVERKLKMIRTIWSQQDEKDSAD